MKILALLLALGILVTGIMWAVEINNSSPFCYSGDIVFDNEKDFTQFKEFITQEDVEILAVDVLASKPPIWVRYKVVVSESLGEPPIRYDNKDRYVTGPGGTMIGPAFVIVVGIAGMLFTAHWIFNEPRKESGRYQAL